MNQIDVTRACSHFRGSVSHFRGHLVATVAVLLVAMGCGNSVPGVEIDASTPVDAATPPIDATPPIPMTFRLSYAPLLPKPPGDSIHVETACSQTWVRVIDGEGAYIAIDTDCGVCRCDTCGSCAICGCALLIEPIPAATSRDHAWDGVTHPGRNEAACGFCTFDSTLPAGTYTARFCYSFTFGGPLECGDEVFDYPSATVVEHVVTGPAS